jgi:hypothetical protein
MRSDARLALQLGRTAIELPNGRDQGDDAK